MLAWRPNEPNEETMAGKKAAKKTTTKKKAAKKKPAKRSAASQKRRSPSRKRLTPAKTERGLSGTELGLSLDEPALAELRSEIEGVGGGALGAYREPLGGRPIMLAALPIKTVQPTPFQRDLSPTHTKRLAKKIEESGSFLDPLIVVRGADGKLWTPNGRHRLAAAKVLGLRTITALVSLDESLAFKILALNTEKAHNLKDRSLEVIRMARELAARHPRHHEGDYANEFEEPALLTLGIAYEGNKRFAGSAYNPVLRKVERFSSKTLPASLRQRHDWAARLGQVEALVKEVIAGLQARGFKSPYLRSYVVARINPVRFVKVEKGATEPPMTMAAALTRMHAAAKRFDLSSVKERDLGLIAGVLSE